MRRQELARAALVRGTRAGRKTVSQKLHADGVVLGEVGHEALQLVHLEQGGAQQRRSSVQLQEASENRVGHYFATPSFQKVGAGLQLELNARGECEIAYVVPGFAAEESRLFGVFDKILSINGTDISGGRATLSGAQLRACV